jgi:hypothetical protein
MPPIDSINVPAFFLANNTSCRSWSELSRLRRMQAALMYLHPGVFVGDGGTTSWTAVPIELYRHGEAFMRRVNDFCGVMEVQYRDAYLAQWPVYGWYGGWGVPRWRWHGGPRHRMPHGPMPHFPGPGPHGPPMGGGGPGPGPHSPPMGGGGPPLTHGGR